MDTAPAPASGLPDLRAIPLDKLAGTPLAEAIALYRKRMAEVAVPLSSFNSSIR